jgi:hypothetical protein
MPDDTPNEVAITPHKTIPDQLRPEFLQLIKESFQGATNGMHVDRVQFVAEFRVNVESFRERVKAKNLDSRQREHILRMADKAYHDVQRRFTIAQKALEKKQSVTHDQQSEDKQDA